MTEITVDMVIFIIPTLVALIIIIMIIAVAHTDDTVVAVHSDYVLYLI